MPVSKAEKHSKARTGKLSQEFGFAEFLSFVPLQRKTQCLRQNLVAKVLWHLKNSDLSKAPSQSPRIPLWHLKSHTLPKASSQSPRIRLWHLKCRYFPKASSQSPESDRRFHKRKNIPRRKPANYRKNSVIRTPVANKNSKA